MYEYEHLNGPFFANFVKQHFPIMFGIASKARRMFLKDNAPNQNTACVRGAIRRLKAKKLQFPPRSGDLNPIENVFKSVKQLLHKQGIRDDIEYETYDEFKICVIDTLKHFSVTEIDNTIDRLLNKVLTKNVDKNIS